MGLDMYLKARVYISGCNYNGRDTSKYDTIMKTAGLSRCEDCPSCTVEACVMYWRKSNQIHAWFVSECGGGEDECQPIYVSRQQLQELYELCVIVLSTRDSDKLPPQDGFFFGSTEVDQYYWEDVENTAVGLASILEDPDLSKFDFVYQASW